jgi:hypothetical protein
MHPATKYRDVVISLKLRKWQWPLVEYFRKKRAGNTAAHASVVAHRRAGKDRAALFIELEEALTSPREVWHCLPEYAQARKVIWSAITGQGERLIDTIFHKEIVAKSNEQDMSIRLVNGSLWRLVGADNFNSLVGPNPKFVTFSEFALMRPQARDFVRPILAENGGSELMITTPRSYNHAFDVHEYAKKARGWYHALHPVSQTKLIPDDVLAVERASMPPELYEQEYECSFSAANVGAILGSRVETAEREGRVSDDFVRDPAQPVIVSSDIGFRDAAAFWFWQPKPDGLALIDYQEESGLDADDWIERLAGRYNYSRFWLPHDARAKTFATKRSAIERFKAAGFPVALVPQVSVAHRVNAARMMMARCRFIASPCARGLLALRSWSYEWDADRRTFSKEPLHDEWSHGGDAFSYGALMLQQAVADVPAKPLPKVAADTFTLDKLYADREQAQTHGDWR